ncbi:MAG TPA: prephenate dehydratase domain-containing protein [Gaiellaceae bacterium]|jgi:prephenate dehydratase|nr:prephenate dehydratase domain-containing protein [Gaiellaceae bacterium]
MSQRTTTRPIVGYPGRDGAHSAAACERLFSGDADLVALPSFAAVTQATADGTIDVGVLPIESSLVGPVAETHDLLYDSPLAITGETVVPIRHFLVGPGEIALDEIRAVHSHPVALDQCRRLLASLPQATAIAAATTADAAAEVAERGDPAEVAIASERAARLHDLAIVASDVGDHPEAFTRFVSVATHMRLDVNGKPWRTAFSFVTDHQPGALHRAIEPFARHRIDLLQLVSRPIPQSPWKYRFDAVLTGHPLDPIVRETLAELRERTRLLRVFGSYPAEVHHD